MRFTFDLFIMEAEQFCKRFFFRLGTVAHVTWRLAQDYGEVPVINTRGLQGLVVRLDRVVN